MEKWGPHTCDHCYMAAGENRDLAFFACRRVEGYFKGVCDGCVVDENEGQCAVRDDKVEKEAMYIIRAPSDDEDDYNHNDDDDGEEDGGEGEGEGEDGWGKHTK